MDRWRCIHMCLPRERVNDLRVDASGSLVTVSSGGFVRTVRDDQVVNETRISLASATDGPDTSDTSWLHLRCVAFDPASGEGWIGVLTGLSRPEHDVRLLHRPDDSAPWSAVEGELLPAPRLGFCGFSPAPNGALYAVGTYQHAVGPPAVWRHGPGSSPREWSAVDLTARTGLDLAQLIDIHAWSDNRALAVGGQRRGDRIEPVAMMIEDAGRQCRAIELPELSYDSERPTLGRYAWKLFFVDDDWGFMALSSFGGNLDNLAYILETRNGGEQWAVHEFRRGPYGSDLHGIGMLPEGHGWVCAHGRSPMKITADRRWVRNEQSPLSDVNRFAWFDGALHCVGNGLFRYDQTPSDGT